MIFCKSSFFFLISLCWYSTSIASIPKSKPLTYEQQLDSMEQSIKSLAQELNEAEVLKQKQLKEIEDVKRQLKGDKKPISYQYTPSISSHPSLFEKDYLRYPANPYPPYFKLVSKDGQRELDFHGWIQGDADLFMNTNGLVLNNGYDVTPIYSKNTVDRFWVRRIRPDFEGKVLDYVQYLFNPDFGLYQSRVYDAFVDINYWRAMGLQFGQQMSIVSGIENYFNNFDYLSRAFTMENSSTAMLAPDREFGFVLHGSFGPSGQEPYFRGISYLGFDDFFSYQLALMGGTADATEPGNQVTSYLEETSHISSLLNKAFEGRVFFNPFIAQHGHWLQHLGIGFAGSTQRVNNEINLPSYLSLGQNPIFDFAESVVANGPRSRLHPQMVWGVGSLGLLADWTQTIQNLSIAPDTEFYGVVPNVKTNNKASQIQLIYNVTKEEFNLFHLIPNRNFHPFEKGAYGAFQLVLRLTHLSLDNSVFSYPNTNTSENSVSYPYADPRISIQSYNGWSVGFNWFWNENLRITTEYDQTEFLGGCSTGALSNPDSPGCLTGGIYTIATNSQVINRPMEKIFMQRFQVTF